MLKEVGFSEAQARAILQMMSQDSASKQDLEYATAELKRDIRQLDTKMETVRAELKRDIGELNTKMETVRAELKRDIREVESRLSMRMIITSGGFAFAMLTALVTLAKLGLLSPAN